MQSIDHDSPGLLDDLRQVLVDTGVAYVRGVGGDDQLLALAESLGAITEPGVAMPSQSHDGRIYSVHVRNEGRGVIDQHGNVIVSTTHQEFSLHTDAYNRPSPPRYVLLLRVDNGPDDTPSFVSDARLAIKSLPSSVASTLTQSIFPAAFGPAALVTASQPPEVRFNEAELRRWAGRDTNPLLSLRAEDAISQFAHSLRLHQETQVIRQTDCLVLDNYRVCHGRSAMASESKRELKRVWVA
jgi:alpha-ketoglutarate-dependent taurine dioxygenase